MSDAARDSTGKAKSKAKSEVSLGPRAYTSPAAWILFLVPAILGLAGDQWLKYWAFPNGVPTDTTLMHIAGRNSAMNDPWPVIPKVLGFTTTVNQGAVFGIGQGRVGLFLGFSIIALAIIIWVFATSGAKHRVVHLALGLITAGALGNLYDRAIFHGVRDMLRFYVDWYPYIFNVADVLLCVGVPLLIVRWMFVTDDAPEPAKKWGRRRFILFRQRSPDKPD